MAKYCSVCLEDVVLYSVIDIEMSKQNALCDLIIIMHYGSGSQRVWHRKRNKNILLKC